MFWEGLKFEAGKWVVRGIMALAIVVGVSYAARYYYQSTVSAVTQPISKAADKVIDKVKDAAQTARERAPEVLQRTQETASEIKKDALERWHQWREKK